MLEEAGRHFLRQKLFSLHIQVPVNVRCHLNIGVTHVFLHIFQRTAQMKSMMLGVMESQDYRQTLIRNCKSVIWPTIRHYPGEVLEQIDWDDAVMCAEALGKRGFILEVLPASALDLVIDRTAPEKRERGESLAERVGRILGLHRVS